jgi:DNA-binding CsgD family transcriptional regulator
MGLLYCSISFGLIAANLRGSGKSGGDPTVLFHFVLALLVGMGMYRAAKKKRDDHPAWPMLLTALTALTGLTCAVIPILPGDWPLLLFNGKPPMISISAAMFMPVGLSLFFRTAPRGREGFFYGLIMAFGELLWVALFPLLGGASDDLTASGKAFHLFTLNCLTMGGTGLCLGAAFYLYGATETNMNGSADTDKPPAVSRDTRTSLLWIFGAGTGIFILMGLETGMSLPKTALASGFISLPYFIPLFFLPLAGWMLDGENPGSLMALLVPVCLLVPFLGLAQKGDLIDPLAMFCLISVARQTLLLAILTASARLLKTHALLSLLLTLAHCLHLAQLGGALSRKALFAVPYGVEAASFALAAGAAFCLWRVRRLLLEKPELWELPLEKNVAPEPDMEKFDSFAAAHDLTRRERELLLGMIRGASLEDLAGTFGIAISTVRYHQTGLLKKTGMPSRSNLLRCFTSWHFRQP